MEETPYSFSCRYSLSKSIDFLIFGVFAHLEILQSEGFVTHCKLNLTFHCELVANIAFYIRWQGKTACVNKGMECGTFSMSIMKKKTNDLPYCVHYIH